MASCPQCKLFQEETSKQILFSRFVTKVLKRLNKNFNTGGASRIQFIAWDDMFRGWSTSELDMLKVNGQNSFQPCIWSYPGDQGAFQSITSNQMISNTLLNFDKIWFCSAFRGCCKPDSTLVDHVQRL